MTKNIIMTAGVLASALFLAADASALFVSNAKVLMVRTTANSDDIYISFDRAVTSGCLLSQNHVVAITSSNVTTATRREKILQIALAARLSGRAVEVETASGCPDGVGARLTSISIK